MGLRKVVRRMKRVAPKGRAFLLALALFPLLPALPSAGVNPAGPRESRYEIFSHGLRVGDLTTLFDLVTHKDRKALRFESVTRVKANFLLFSVSLDSREEAVVAEEGTVHYRRTERNGKGKGVTRVDGRLENGRFLLDVTENGANRTIAFDRGRYDHTTMECPEVTMKREGEEMAVRLLDFETLSVVTRRYRWVRSEDVIVDGKPVRCRVIDSEDPHKKGRRWIRPDDVGVVIARQEGKGKDGSYSLRMTHLHVRN